DKQARQQIRESPRGVGSHGPAARQRVSARRRDRLGDHRAGASKSLKAKWSGANPVPIRQAQTVTELTKLLKYQRGRVAEWFKAPVLKTGRGLCSLVSSNLTPSATKFVFQLLSHCFSSAVFQFRRTLFVVRADRNVQRHDVVGRFPIRNRIIAKPNPIGLP